MYRGVTWAVPDSQIDVKDRLPEALLPLNLASGAYRNSTCKVYIKGRCYIINLPAAN